MIFLCAYAVVFGSCENGRDRHLVCKDGNGIVVVDTTDLNHEPRQYEAAWSWNTVSDDTYHEVSVPPHACVYESRPTPKKPETPQYAEAPE